MKNQVLNKLMEPTHL